jgi:hypothetical protein
VYIEFTSSTGEVLTLICQSPFLDTDMLFYNMFTQIFPEFYG